MGYMVEPINFKGLPLDLLTGIPVRCHTYTAAFTEALMAGGCAWPVGNGGCRRSWRMKWWGSPLLSTSWDDGCKESRLDAMWITLPNEIEYVSLNKNCLFFCFHFHVSFQGCSVHGCSTHSRLAHHLRLAGKRFHKMILRKITPLKQLHFWKKTGSLTEGPKTTSIGSTYRWRLVITTFDSWIHSQEPSRPAKLRRCFFVDWRLMTSLCHLPWPKRRPHFFSKRKTSFGCLISSFFSRELSK